MTEEREEEGVIEEELERENGEPLRDREQISIIKEPGELVEGGGYTVPIERPATE